METLVILAVVIGLGFLIRKVWRGIIPKQSTNEGLRFKIKVRAVVFVIVTLIVIIVVGYFIWTV